MLLYTLHLCSMPKTVQLSEEAYATLAALKRPGESFSDTVKRLAASQKDPYALRALRSLPRVKGYDYGKLHRASAETDRKRLEKRLGLKLRAPDEEG